METRPAKPNSSLLARLTESRTSSPSFSVSADHGTLLKSIDSSETLSTYKALIEKTKNTAASRQRSRPEISRRSSHRGSRSGVARSPSPRGSKKSSKKPLKVTGVGVKMDVKGMLEKARISHALQPGRSGLREAVNEETFEVNALSEPRIYVPGEQPEEAAHVGAADEDRQAHLHKMEARLKQKEDELRLFEEQKQQEAARLQMEAEELEAREKHLLARAKSLEEKERVRRESEANLLARAESMEEKERVRLEKEGELARKADELLAKEGQTSAHFLARAESLEVKEQRWREQEAELVRKEEELAKKEAALRSLAASTGPHLPTPVVTVTLSHSQEEKARERQAEEDELAPREKELLRCKKEEVMFEVIEAKMEVSLQDKKERWLQRSVESAGRGDDEAIDEREGGNDRQQRESAEGKDKDAVDEKVGVRIEKAAESRAVDEPETREDVGAPVGCGGEREPVVSAGSEPSHSTIKTGTNPSEPEESDEDRIERLLASNRRANIEKVRMREEARRKTKEEAERRDAQQGNVETKQEKKVGKSLNEEKAKERAVTPEKKRIADAKRIETPASLHQTAEEVTGGWHTLDDLKMKPKGLDHTKLEAYLSPSEFRSVFKMDKASFAKLPAWKKQKSKRSVGLF